MLLTKNSLFPENIVLLYFSFLIGRENFIVCFPEEVELCPLGRSLHL